MGYKTHTLAEFMFKDYPPVEHILAPWLPRRGLAMVTGWRGIGKTFFGLTVAYTIATGGDMLGWKAPKPRKVLYVDGEMDPAELQDRLRMIDTAARRDRNGEPGEANKNLTILTHADQPHGIADLADPDSGTGRRWIEDAAADCEVLKLDNYSALCRSGVENDADSWTVMQEWLLSLRRAEKTVVGFHHAGKPRADGSVAQRGTSKKEDILNTSILLGHGRGNGTFSLTFSKNRGFRPPDEPMIIHMEVADGCCRFVEASKEGQELEVRSLYADGMSLGEIAAKTGLSKATVGRWIPDEEKRRPGRKNKVSHPDDSETLRRLEEELE